MSVNGDIGFQMGFKDTVRVVQPGGRRLKVFVDFWNVVISARQQASKFDVEVRWDALTELILSSTHRGFGDETIGELSGCYIFGSYAKSNPDEHAFVNRTLDTFGCKPGLFFEFRERLKKQTTDKCSQCGAQVTRNSELGVDVLSTVEMIKHAAMRDHEYLALLSSDRDYIPLLSFLKDHGHRVLHISPGEPHRDMRSISWAQVDLRSLYPHVCTVEPRKVLVITAPAFAERLADVRAVLDEQEKQYDVIDISDKSNIPDKDLVFLLSNQNIFFKKKKGDAQAYSFSRLFQSVDELREAARKGKVVCAFLM
ncbi:MAG: NYN domain-containing protein [Rhodomicrobium sp.]